MSSAAGKAFSNWSVGEGSAMATESLRSPTLDKATNISIITARTPLSVISRSYGKSLIYPAHREEQGALEEKTATGT